MKSDFLKRMKDYINNLSPEEIKSRILKLNGKMTIDLFEKVLKEVKEKGYTVDEELHYFPERHSVTKEEFMDVFNYIEEVGQKYIQEESKKYFSSSVIEFKYKNDYYLWEVTYGQGSSCSIEYLEYPVKYPFCIETIDENIRFYKVEIE